MSASCFNLVTVPIRSENFDDWKEKAVRYCSQMPDYDIVVASKFLEYIDHSNIMFGASGDVLCWFNDGKSLINFNDSLSMAIWEKLVRLSYPVNRRYTRNALVPEYHRWIIQTQYENSDEIKVGTFWFNLDYDKLSFKTMVLPNMGWINFDGE